MEKVREDKEDVKIVFYHGNIIRFKVIKDVAINPEDGSLLIFKPDTLLQGKRLTLTIVYVKRTTDGMDYDTAIMPIEKTDRVELVSSKGCTVLYKME